METNTEQPESQDVGWIIRWGPTVGYVYSAFLLIGCIIPAVATHTIEIVYIFWPVGLIGYVFPFWSVSLAARKGRLEFARATFILTFFGLGPLLGLIALIQKPSQEVIARQLDTACPNCQSINFTIKEAFLDPDSGQKYHLNPQENAGLWGGILMLVLFPFCAVAGFSGVGVIGFIPALAWVIFGITGLIVPGVASIRAYLRMKDKRKIKELTCKDCNTQWDLDTVQQ